jgi:hypothetical protein
MPNKGFEELQLDSATNRVGRSQAVSLASGNGARTGLVWVVTHRRTEPTLDLPTPKNDISYFLLTVGNLQISEIPLSAGSAPECDRALRIAKLQIVDQRHGCAAWPR